MIDPGNLNDRVTLQKRSIAANPASGWSEETFEDFATIWAQFRPTTGREFREGSVAIGEERATFTVHFREDLTQADRLVYGGQIWNIRSIVRVGWKEALDLNCSSTGAAA